MAIRGHSLTVTMFLPLGNRYTAFVGLRDRSYFNEDCMTYDVILRKAQNKYIARVREWPEVVIEEETREAALTQIKQQLAAYLSQQPEVVPIELEPDAVPSHPWLQFAGMWEHDPTWADFEAEVATYRQQLDEIDHEA